MEELRKKLRAEKTPNKEGKPLTSFERLAMEKELDDLWHPKREPERKAA